MIYNIHRGKVKYKYQTKRKMNEGSVDCMFRTLKGEIALDDGSLIKKVKRMSGKDNITITGFEIKYNQGISNNY